MFQLLNLAMIISSWTSELLRIHEKPLDYIQPALISRFEGRPGAYCLTKASDLSARCPNFAWCNSLKLWSHAPRLALDFLFEIH